MRAARFLPGLLCGLLLGCQAPSAPPAPSPQPSPMPQPPAPPQAPSAELKPAHAVYEAFFSANADAGGWPTYVAGVTEHHWFAAHPFQPGDWAGRLDGLGGIPLALVEALYRVNQEPAPLDWEPVDAEVAFLPPDYARAPGLADLEALCLVAGEALPVALRAREENYFRPYYTVSRVAFSADRGLALLKYTRHCAPLGGGGEFFLALKLAEGQWRIIGGVPVSG